jgi:hypothetical protein
LAIDAFPSAPINELDTVSTGFKEDIGGFLVIASKLIVSDGFETMFGAVTADSACFVSTASVGDSEAVAFL